MRTNLIPNSYIRETQSWIKDQGLYVCITEKWKEILTALNKNEYNYIKLFLTDKSLSKKDFNSFIQHISLLIKKFDSKLDNIAIEKQKKLKNIHAAHTDKSFIIKLWEEKFFVKILLDSTEMFNGYNESLWLEYSKQLLQNTLDTINNNSITIHIDIIDSLYAIYNKKNKSSLIITPYMEGYEQLEQILQHKSPTTINERDKQKILLYLTTIENELKKSNQLMISDILQPRNILVKKTDKWHINLLLTDPYIENWCIHTLHTELTQYH